MQWRISWPSLAGTPCFNAIIPNIEVWKCQVPDLNLTMRMCINLLVHVSWGFKQSFKSSFVVPLWFVAYDL